MTVDPAIANAYDRVVARGADAQAAFVPGGAPSFDDASVPRSDRSSVDPLCVAPPEGAYFVAAGGKGDPIFTQDGALHVSESSLVDASGRPMLGYAAEGGPLQALHVDAVDEALGRVRNARVDAQGRLVYERRSIDPRSGQTIAQTVVAGRLALARFPAATRLQQVDASHRSAPPGTIPHYGTAGDGQFGDVSPMRRRNSSAGIDAALSRLNEAYVAFDAVQAAGRTQHRAVKSAMDLVK